MNNNYLTIINHIKHFAKNHSQIERFESDFDEQIDNFTSADKSFPILFSSPENNVMIANQNNDFNLLTLKFYCLDLLQKDRSNINHILSNTNLILNDLFLYFKSADEDIIIVNNATAIPLNNYGVDYLAGWEVSITFEFITNTFCQIPLNIDLNNNTTTD